MAAIDLNKLKCKNEICKEFGKQKADQIKTYGFYKTALGKRRRFICRSCKKTFSMNTGTPYSGLRKSKNTFDKVAISSVEGTSKSAIARIHKLSLSTVCRWLDLAEVAAEKFNAQNLKGYQLTEIQADELKFYAATSLKQGDKGKEEWVFTAMEVSSRLWPAFVVGNRSSKHTQELFDKLSSTGKFGDKKILFTTDGFQFYKSAINKTFGPLAVYAQVIKMIRKNRIVKVGEELVLGRAHQLEELLENSECSSKINTAFIERLNLTIRQGSAFLNRRTAAFSREERCFQGHLYLLQAYYNFSRFHRSLKCGTVHRTPAMEAGIASRQIDFREIFSFWVLGDRFFLVHDDCEQKISSIAAFAARWLCEFPKIDCDSRRYNLAA